MSVRTSAFLYRFVEDPPIHSVKDEEGKGRFRAFSVKKLPLIAPVCGIRSIYSIRSMVRALYGRLNSPLTPFFLYFRVRRPIICLCFAAVLYFMRVRRGNPQIKERHCSLHRARRKLLLHREARLCCCRTERIKWNAYAP
jgi:hypothetical protein